VVMSRYERACRNLLVGAPHKEPALLSAGTRLA
jgi:hypothetical protein